MTNCIGTTPAIAGAENDPAPQKKDLLFKRMAQRIRKGNNNARESKQ